MVRPVRGNMDKTMTENEIYKEVGTNIVPKYKAIKKLIELGYEEPFLTDELNALDKQIKKYVEVLKSIKK